MDVITFVKRYAEQIDGQFTDYDHKTAVVILPLTGGRYQTVLATARNAGKNELTVFSSKVSPVMPEVDLQGLLERSSKLDHSKFVIEDGFIKVEGTCFSDTVREEHVKQMLHEIASVADEYEFRLTGQDIH